MFFSARSFTATNYTKWLQKSHGDTQSLPHFEATIAISSEAARTSRRTSNNTKGWRKRFLFPLLSLGISTTGTASTAADAGTQTDRFHSKLVFF